MKNAALIVWFFLQAAFGTFVLGRSFKAQTGIAALVLLCLGLSGCCIDYGYRCAHFPQPISANELASINETVSRMDAASASVVFKGEGR